MKSKTLILPEVSSLLMIQIYDNAVNDCGGLAENMYFLSLYVYLFLIFFVIWNIVSNNMSMSMKIFM